MDYNHTGVLDSIEFQDLKDNGKQITFSKFLSAMLAKNQEKEDLNATFETTR